MKRKQSAKLREKLMSGESMTTRRRFVVRYVQAHEYHHIGPVRMLTVIAFVNVSDLYVDITVMVVVADCISWCSNEFT